MSNNTLLEDIMSSMRSLTFMATMAVRRVPEAAVGTRNPEVDTSRDETRTTSIVKKWRVCGDVRLSALIAVASVSFIFVTERFSSEPDREASPAPLLARAPRWSRVRSAFAVLVSAHPGCSDRCPALVDR